MSFANPNFLYGLFALLIPVIIHLFNFRRYKTVYFSNVKMLQEIMQKTRRESQIQHLIVLLLRMVAIAAIVLAFAQPYKTGNATTDGEGSLVTIFVDNSFSMNANSEDGPLLQSAVNHAKEIVNSYGFGDEFILITQDFSSKHSHIMNKDEILGILDDIEISPNHKSISDVMAKKDHIAQDARCQNEVNYILSDFQKSGFNAQELKDTAKTYLIPLTAAEVNNVAIDSVWFSAPVFKKGQEINLCVRVQNYGEADVIKLPLKLYINNTQQALAAVDIKANSFSDCQLRYTIHDEGIQCGQVEISDSPIIFDDKFYFVYNVSSATHIIAISENKPNRYLKAMFGYDSLFVYSEMTKSKINYSLFKESRLIILDQLTDISTGLQDELSKFVANGGDLLIFPAKEMADGNWQQFLTSLGTGRFTNLNTSSLKIGEINYESIYFKDALQKQNDRVDMPTVTNYYAMTTQSENPEEVIMRLENNAPLLTATSVGKGHVFTSAVAMDDFFGEAHRHALFFVPLHNIAIKSQKTEQIYNIIGKDDEWVLSDKIPSSEDILTIRAQKGNFEFIPEHKGTNGETRLFFHSQVTESGLYDLEQGTILVSALAFNYGTQESELSYYDNGELEKMFNGNDNVTVLDGTPHTLMPQLSEQTKGHAIWRYFIFVALAALLAEILVLRLWGRNPIENRQQKDK